MGEPDVVIRFAEDAAAEAAAAIATELGETRRRNTETAKRLARYQVGLSDAVVVKLTLAALVDELMPEGHPGRASFELNLAKKIAAVLGEAEQQVRRAQIVQAKHIRPTGRG